MANQAAPTNLAAVPRYVGAQFGDAPPGHRFGLYFAGWMQNWSLDPTGKNAALRAVAARAPTGAMRALRELRRRQWLLATRSGGDVVTIGAKTTAPLVTGVGMEHPLENGFAFLQPHGLPYLPGSSVKGVVRRAAEELALFEKDPRGWSVGAVWWLFGFEFTSGYFVDVARDAHASEREEAERWLAAYRRRLEAGDPLAEEFFDRHRAALAESFPNVAGEGPLALPRQKAREHIHQAGALEFWDAWIEPPGDALRVDIMNPHFTHYYQAHGGQQPLPPSDDGDPNPIFFLAVPPEAKVVFHVRLRPVGRRVPDKLAACWKDLVRAALLYACDVLGFGAKTAVGYGRMREDDSQLKRWADEAREAAEEAEHRAAEERRRREAEERQRALEAMGPLDRLLLELEDCPEQRVHEIYARDFKNLEEAAGDDRKRLAAALKEAYVRLGKWSGSQSARQQEKIRTIKAALGET